MKSAIAILALTFITNKAYVSTKDIDDYKEVAKTGDIILQTNFDTPAAYALHVGTLSKYNHAGVVVREGEKYFVYEALRHIKKTPLSGYIKRKGTLNRFTVTRVEMTKKQRSKVAAYVKSKKGKNYDPELNWSDKNYYCSELAYKAYLSAGIKIYEPKKLKDMPLAVFISKNMKHNFRINRISLDQKVVSPADLGRFWRVKQVFTNY
tara:strand:- start:170 stop:790 length:621 start_codon:yes stop_codon:yes gene_type:complete